MTFRRTDKHPEGTMALTVADETLYGIEAYKKCLTNLDELNRLITHTYSCIQRDPSNIKYQARYHGLTILRDVDNGEDM